MPRIFHGRTIYSPAELRAMSPEDRQAVRDAHRPFAAVQPGEVDPEFDARATAELDRQMHERLTREHLEHEHRAAS